MNALERLILRKVLKNMLTNFTKHWKTSLAGILTGVLQVIANGRSWQSIGLAVVTAILGALAKDPNSTN